MRINPELCIRCRGEYNLCGLAYCPILVNKWTLRRIKPLEGKQDVNGSSPPSVMVGRLGYPKVRVYPATPPTHGNTSWLEEPRVWLNMRLEDFLSSRLTLIRGSIAFNINDPRNPPRQLHDIQVMAISSGPVDAELTLAKPIKGNVTLNEQEPPIGPSAPLRSIKLSTTPQPTRAVEKAYSDVDLKANDAVWMLYGSGIDVHVISRLMSIGAIGRGRARRLVPTRWSITAVDEEVSNRLIDKVKDYPELSEYRVYVRRSNSNLFLGILAPHTWLYEWGEAWWPGSTWNTWGSEPVVEVDAEGYWGRDTYPSIGGCYYAARLAAAEALNSMRRQAAVILWREIYPGFNIPVGVWFVRENARAMFKGEYTSFSSLDEALKFASSQLKLPLAKWASKSYVLRRLREARLL
ncbi:Nre family DNA repair protein [Caldivirga sp. UBA161]|uniref:Nre family DNA repair protein n=1 Tax=Caldivirga sp. UBA161 TaxID=1915569 RepID=UPI0025BF2584|nr:Nre family DNA repair protein [Caldivirga sp. UBA161]